MTTTREAGYKLRVLRAAKKRTLREVEQDLHGAVSLQQLSRLENGSVDKPPMRDLVIYGNYLGLTPNELATLYGYWYDPRESREAEHPSMIRLRSVLTRLPEGGQAELLHWIDFAVAQALATA